METMHEFTPETVSLAELRPHPRNYREHPDDQLEHLIESIREHGLYRNIAIARDGTILAGHGVAKAARKMGLETIPVLRLDLDPDDPRALKLLAGDNEIANLAEIDDRALTELLREVKEFDVDGLLGTGYDEQQLANLLMVTRPKNEIEDFNEAAEWIGMPDFEPDIAPLKMVVSFRSEEDREKFVEFLGISVTGKTKSIWWPAKERRDLGSIRFEDGPDDAP